MIYSNGIVASFYKMMAHVIRIVKAIEYNPIYTEILVAEINSNF